MNKMKFKLLMVAVTAALGVSSQAMAAYTNGNGATGSSLILNVFDSTTNESYSATLDISPNNLTYGTFNGGASFTALASNSTFTSMFGDNIGSNVHWEVVSGLNDAFSGGSAGDNIPWSLGFTAASAPAALTGFNVDQANRKLNTWTTTVINNHQTSANSGLTTSTDPSQIWNMNNAAAAFGGDQGGGSIPFSITGLLGGALSYFTATVNGSTADDASTFAQILGTWSLASNGTLTWNATAAVVPVPAAVWLLGSGLLGLVGVGRRRSSNTGSNVVAA